MAIWTPLTIERFCQITGLDPTTLPEDCNPEVDEEGNYRARFYYNQELADTMTYSIATTVA